MTQRQLSDTGADALVEYFIPHILDLQDGDGKIWIDLGKLPRIRRPGRGNRKVSYSPGEDARTARVGMENAAALAIISDLTRFLGPLDEELVCELERNMLEERYLPQFPIITYKGRTLDGRHREEAARRAGANAHREPFRGDDIGAARIILDSLTRKHLTGKQRRDLVKAFQDAGFDRDQVARDLGIDSASRKAKWARIDAALIEYPELSHSAIAKRLGDGISHNTVAARCAILVVKLTTKTCQHLTTSEGEPAHGRTPGSGTGSNVPSEDEYEKLTKAAVAGLEQGLTQTEIGKELGHRDNSMILGKVVAVAQDRLKPKPREYILAEIKQAKLSREDIDWLREQLSQLH
jgi:hypothetical protein